MWDVCVPANAQILPIDRGEAGVALAVLSLPPFQGWYSRIQACPRADDEEGKVYFWRTQALFFSYFFPFSQCSHAFITYSCQNLLSFSSYQFFSC